MNIRVNNTINKFSMINDGDNIIVGLSGGADSVSLTHFLCNYNKRKNVRVFAAHINHGIRGREADRDEEFVKKFCLELGIKLYVKKINVKEMALKQGIGVEECGRNVRYRYFDELANELNGKIATAHSLSDSEETVVLNMIRGCGLKGLCGIPPVRNNIIRPLIFTSREEIEEYCKNNHLDYVVDSSNLTQDYNRNKVRLSIIPVMKSINNMFDSTFRRMVEQNIEEENFLNELSEKSMKNAETINGYDVTRLKNIDNAIKSRVIKKILEQYCGAEVENKHVRIASGIIDNMRGGMTLPCNTNIYVNRTELVKRKCNNKDVNWEYKFYGTNVLTESGIRFIMEILPIHDYNNMVKSNRLKNYVSLDSQCIPDNALIRNRRNGDKFCQAGRGVTKKVKKLFNELKIPEGKRNSIVMLAEGNKVLWIDGIGICEECKVSDSTKHVAVIRRENTNDELSR